MERKKLLSSVAAWRGGHICDPLNWKVTTLVAGYDEGLPPVDSFRPTEQKKIV